jgi:hypothetical protein
MPFIARAPQGGPFNGYYEAFSNMGADCDRYSPWYGHPWAVNLFERFTKYVNCSSATPAYGACSKLPDGGGSELSVEWLYSCTNVLSLGGRSGVVTYDRELNATAPRIFEGHNSMTYSMRFHL